MWTIVCVLAMQVGQKGSLPRQNKEGYKTEIEYLSICVCVCLFPLSPLLARAVVKCLYALTDEFRHCTLLHSLCLRLQIRVGVAPCNSYGICPPNNSSVFCDCGHYERHYGREEESNVKCLLLLSLRLARPVPCKNIQQRKQAYFSEPKCNGKQIKWREWQYCVFAMRQQLMTCR